MVILGIETSCDETAAAVARGQGEGVEILSNIVSSQMEIHQKYGGVVPEVAAREHVLNILPVIDEALAGAKINRADAPKKLDAISVTIGPGLITSLQTGIETAKTLAFVWGLPIVAVNHIEAHIYANFINTQHATRNTQLGINFPAVILTVSGGHTMLVLMHGYGKFYTIGETRDDAAGEAFDKAASMLGIGYPGGPAIAAKAEALRVTRYALRDKKYKKTKILLPRPMIKGPDFDFSFSGLKTALKYELAKDKNWKKRIPEYAAEFQQAVIDVLIHKTIKAAEKYGAKTVMLAGGVAANLELRRQMAEAVKTIIPQSAFRIPHLSHTTDNAAMVAAAGYFRARAKEFTPWQKLRVNCNAKL